MKTLNQFKAENNISKIDFLKGNGRAFATVNDKQLLVSKEFDSSKAAYVTTLSTFNNGKDDTEGSTLVPNAFVLCNSTVELVFSL